MATRQQMLVNFGNFLKNYNESIGNDLVRLDWAVKDQRKRMCSVHSNKTIAAVHACVAPFLAKTAALNFD